MPVLPSGLVIAAVLIEILLFGLTRLTGKSSAVPAVILTLISAHIVYLMTVYWAYLRRQNTLPTLFIIGVALIFRVTVWPLTGPVTDDLYRYRWEAQVQSLGGNPYSSRPIDPEWASLRDSTWPQVGQKDVPAGYGPAWEAISWLTYRFASAITSDPHRQAFWFKLPAALFDLCTIALLWIWLRKRSLPLDRILVYAWCPLPVWEFWANGHNDAPVLCFLVGALLLADGRRWVLASASLGAAVALKFWPVLLIPAFTIRSRRWYFPVIAGLVFVFCALPYATDVQWNARYMSGFVGGWRNNDSIFGLLLAVTADQYQAKYLAFGLIFAFALWFATRPWRLEKIVLWTIVSLLLLSSNCHPWYLTWFLPLLVFESVGPLLLWSALMPLTYSVWIEWKLLGQWNGSGPLRWFVYIPFFLYLLWWIWDSRKQVLVQNNLSFPPAGDAR